MTFTEREDAQDLLRILRNKIAEEERSVTGFNVGVNSGESAGQTIWHAHIHLISAERVREGRVVTRRPPSEVEWRALEFAWTVVRHVKSNAIVYAFADRLAGVGAGQMSRVDSARLAVQKARVPLAGAVVASDAFFPFRDGLDVAADSGITAVVQPGGSIRDAEVVAAADERGLAMVFTDHRHFRH